jgi:hypothetical protein
MHACSVNVFFFYSCSNTTLKPISHNGPEVLEDCGDSRFYPSVASSPRHFPLVNPPLPDSSKSVYMSQILRLVLQTEYGQGFISFL